MLPKQFALWMEKYITVPFHMSEEVLTLSDEATMRLGVQYYASPPE